MPRLEWDKVGERRYETGVDRGVLYIPNNNGLYTNGYSWNGLTAVTQSPSGAESNKQYADNLVYVNLTSAEEFGGTIEAFTYPDEFAQCDGTAIASGGVFVGQQTRKSFGLSYRSRVGNDLLGADFGYKIHLIYGAQAAPSEKAHATINDSPEAITFSWELTATPVAVGTVGGVAYKPTSILTVDSTKVTAASLAALEDLLYGTAGSSPSLPMPAEVLGLFSTAQTLATPTVPTYNATTKVITIPTVTGVQYFIDGKLVTTPTVTITKTTIVEARPVLPAYKFGPDTDTDWQFTF